MKNPLSLLFPLRRYGELPWWAGTMWYHARKAKTRGGPVPCCTVVRLSCALWYWLRYPAPSLFLRQQADEWRRKYHKKRKESYGWKRLFLNLRAYVREHEEEQP